MITLYFNLAFASDSTVTELSEELGIPQHPDNDDVIIYSTAEKYN